ncbi:hypothetical protein [Adhaeribacter pallidiroseus]|uniref:Uncharacterized protein n=1 Tax=Adhaeribacter pallidiroseus TaxID=2072847 RepID=A0A369QJ24_9BACT|nr:hypothetical protein [Adhaeribacter pallidiroseus]RDC62879.1 hypothetical protein AHMF7616_01478 [Adhaeribacter pallidiroseus]
MSKVIQNLNIEVSNHARNLITVLLEGRDVTNSKIFTGSKWVLKFDEFTTQDDDLDVFILMNGDPGVDASIKVSGIGLAPPETSDEKTFGPNSFAFYSKEIKTTDNGNENV